MFNVTSKLKIFFYYSFVLVVFLVFVSIFTIIHSIEENLSQKNKSYLSQTIFYIKNIKDSLSYLTEYYVGDNSDLSEFAAKNRYIKDLYIVDKNMNIKALSLMDYGVDNAKTFDLYGFEKKLEKNDFYADQFFRSEVNATDDLLLVLKTENKQRLIAIIDMKQIAEDVLGDEKESILIDKDGIYYANNAKNVYFLFNQNTNYTDNFKLNLGINQENAKLTYYIFDYDPNYKIGVVSTKEFSQFMLDKKSLLFFTIFFLLFFIVFYIISYFNYNFNIIKDLKEIFKFSLKLNNDNIKIENVKINDKKFLYPLYNELIKTSSKISLLKNLLQENRLNQDYIFNNFGVLFINAVSGQIVEASNKSLELLNYPKSKLLTKNIFYFIKEGLNIGKDIDVLFNNRNLIFNLNYLNSTTYIAIIKDNTFFQHRLYDLRVLEKKYKDLPFMYVEMDNKYNVLYFSDNLKSIFNDIVGVNFLTLIERERDRAAVRKLLNKQIEFVVIPFFNSQRDIYENFKLTLNKYNNTIYLYFVNVQTFVSNEMKLKNELFVYEEIKKVGYAQYWQYDYDKTLFAISNEFKNLIGMDLYKVVTKDVASEIFEKRDFDILMQELDACKKGEKNSFSIELKINDKNIWIELKGQIIKQGHNTFVIGLSEDITSRVLQNKNLELIYNIFKYSKEGIVIVDEYYTVFEINPAYTELTGYKLRDKKGKMPGLLIELNKNKYLDEIKSFIAEDKVWRGESVEYRINGSSFPVELSVIGVKDGNGNIESYIIIFSDITDKKEYEKTLSEKAYFDTLTKIPNRETFEVKFRKLIESAVEKLALVYFDLDGFKNINDTYGHYYGDQVLIKIAKKIEQKVQKYNSKNFVARFGGDEFGLALNDFGERADLENILFDLLKFIREPIIVEDKELYVGASIGVALLTQTNNSFDDLMEQADSAMYEAKKNGKNQFCFCDTAEYFKTKEYLSILINQDVFDRSNFLLYFQPVYDVKKEKITSFEALIRYKHNDVLFAPKDFLSDIKNKTWFNEVSIWIIKQSIALLNTIKRDDIKISVNIPLSQLSSSEFYEAFNNEFNIFSDVKIGNIQIEISDIAVYRDPLEHILKLDKYMKFGIDFIVDDFDENMITMLDQLPFGTMKLSSKYVVNLFHNFLSFNSLLNIKNKLQYNDVEIIVKGVSTIQEYNLLNSIGFTLMQGEIIEEPMKSELITGFLNDFQQKIPKLSGNLLVNKVEHYKIMLFYIDYLDRLDAEGIKEQRQKVNMFDYKEYLKFRNELNIENLDVQDEIREAHIILEKIFSDDDIEDDVLEELLHSLKTKRLVLMRNFL